MESRSSQSTNVIRFPGARSSASPRRDQKSLMDAVYAAGSLPIQADDRASKDPTGLRAACAHPRRFKHLRFIRGGSQSPPAGIESMATGQKQMRICLPPFLPERPDLAFSFV
jgi:hypothetical protein